MKYFQVAFILLFGLLARAEIRVTDFGAKGDGVTDDTVAIQRAFKAFEAGRPKSRYCVRRHKVVYADAPFEAVVFPEGIYRISAPIVVTGDGMLLGEGRARIVNSSPDSEGVYFRDTHTLVVKGLEFEGGRCQLRLWTRNRDCSYLHVADCVFRNCRGTSVCSVSFKKDAPGKSEPLETAFGEEKGVPYNNSTLMLVERSRFEDNATALELYSDGLTVRDCTFRAPSAVKTPQLNVGRNGHMGVEMYFRDLRIDYPGDVAKDAAAICFMGGRGIFENVQIVSAGDLVAIRSLARFNNYHKPYALDLRNLTLDVGRAGAPSPAAEASPVISFADADFPNRVSVDGIVYNGAARKRLFAFDRDPTRESIGKAYAEKFRVIKEPPEQAFAFMVKNVDELKFDCSLPEELRQYRRPSVPNDWKRPLDHVSGATFALNLSEDPVFSGAPLEELVERARKAGGGTVVLPGTWQEVERTIDVPNNTRITCKGRAALWMQDEKQPIFRVADGVDCVFENLMLIDGRNAVEVVDAGGGHAGRVPLPNGDKVGSRVPRDRARIRLLNCTLLGQMSHSILAHGSKAGSLNVEISGGQAYCPYLYRGNASFTADCFWYEESTERAKGEIRASYSAIVNERGGRMFLREFLGVPCYFQHSPKTEAYQFGLHPERRGEFRWVDNHGVFASVNTRYGGEWGGLTPVYHFGDAVTWIEGGNIELGSVYQKSERAVVVADSARPNVTVTMAASGHHIEPFQVFHRKGDGVYEIAEARLCGNYPFKQCLPVWPKGREGDRDAEFEFAADFSWGGEEPVRLELEASCVTRVYLNGEYVGNGPRFETAAHSRQARFALSPRKGANRLVLRTKKGHPGFLYAQVVEGVRRIARTAPDGDFVCGLSLEERVKPPRSAREFIAGVPEPETDRWQAEIDRVAAAGGGTVIVPRGVHPVGQLELRSNVELHLEEGASLEGVYGLEHYGQLTLPCSEGTWSAVVLAYGATNVAITGKGVIHGRGLRWPTEITCPKGVCKEGLRPRGVFFGDCRGVRLSDFTLRDAACWGVVFKRCDGVDVRRVRVDSHANHNNDGFDVEARNVVIADCDVDSGDDAICIKSNDPDFVVENVLVSNCTARSQCNGLKLGTASHGTMRNIRFVDCRTSNPRRNFSHRNGKHKGRPAYEGRITPEFPQGIGTGAVNIENVDGGTVENVVFDGIEANGFSVPIFIRGGHRERRTCGIPRGKTSRLANLVLRNIRGEACRDQPSSITGVDECPVRGVTLENVHIVCRGEGERNTAPIAEPGPEFDGMYPDAFMFRKLRLPAYGLYVDRTENLVMKDVSFTLRKGTTDARPPVFRRTTAPVYPHPVKYGDTLRDRCWMWGHETGLVDGTNNIWNLEPATVYYPMIEGAKSMGIENLNVVRWDCPDRRFRDSLAGMKRVTWPISGWKLVGERRYKDVGYADLGDWCFKVADEMPNVTGFDLDDFFLVPRGVITVETPTGPRRSCSTIFPYAHLLDLRERLKRYSRPLEIRVVTYDELFEKVDEEALKPVLELSDTITYWTWKAKDTPKLAENLRRLIKLAPGKAIDVGVYLWDFGAKKEMPVESIREQLDIAYDFWRRGEVHGFVFLCSSLCNRPLPAVEYAREWLKRHGDERNCR